MTIFDKDRYSNAMYYFLSTLMRIMRYRGTIVFGPAVDRHIKRKAEIKLKHIRECEMASIASRFMNTLHTMKYPVEAQNVRFNPYVPTTTYGTLSAKIKIYGPKAKY